MTKESAPTNRRRENFKTRKAILGILKQEGPQDSKTLATRLEMTAMGVRQHLYALRDEQLLTYSEQSRPMGRPAKLWELTPAANKFFPDGNSELLVDMIGLVGKVYGADALPRLISARAERQADHYREQLESCRSLEEKLGKIAEMRTAEGYMAEVQSGEEGEFLLIENHCPICEAAQICQNFCSAELGLFRDVLGDGIQVDRVEHILEERRRCVYAVRRGTTK